MEYNTVSDNMETTENSDAINTSTSTATGKSKHGILIAAVVCTLIVVIVGTYLLLRDHGSSGAVVTTTVNGSIVSSSQNSGSSQGSSTQALSTIIYNSSFPYAYVLETGFPAGNIAIVDTTTNSIAGYINSDSFYSLTSVAFSPDGAYAYVTNLGSDNAPSNILIINTSTRSVVGAIDSSVFGKLYGIAFAPDGRYLYITNTNGQAANILIINTTTDTISGAIDTNAINFGSGVYWLYGIAVAPNGQYAYATDYNGGILRINLVNDTITNNSEFILYSTSWWPTGIALSSSGTYAYVSDQFSGKVSIINMATGSIIGNLSVESHKPGYSVVQPGPTGIAVSPAGTYAYVTVGASGNVVIINPNTDSVVGQISGFMYPEGVAFHP